MENQLKKEIERKYAERKKAANAKSEYYRQQLFNDESYVNALNLRNGIKFSLSKAKYAGNLEEIEKNEKKLAEAQADLCKIAARHGITKSMLTPAYSCKICKDTGFDKSGEICVCYKNTIKEVAEEELGISEKSLPTFADVKYTDRNNLEKFYIKIKQYSQNFTIHSKNLVISGNVGTGKSFMAGCICSAVDELGFNTLFLTAYELNSILLRYHTAPIGEKELYAQLLCDCDLLVIDDLGSEPVYKNVTEEYLLMILSRRAANEFPTIITTNLTQEQLLDRYGDRTLSRINDKRRGIFLELKGEDLRRIKQ